jgi:hypothetical protein
VEYEGLGTVLRGQEGRGAIGYPGDSACYRA